MPLTATLRQTTRLTGKMVLRMLPAGGQRTARRNAWGGMSTNASRSRSRREADAALAVSGTVSPQPSDAGQLTSVPG